MLSLYNAEAELVRHQNMMVLQLLALPPHEPMPAELEERARLVLRIQVSPPNASALSPSVYASIHP